MFVWDRDLTCQRLSHFPSAIFSDRTSPFFPPPPRRDSTKATMSRLIVKNLPPYLTPDALRKHFTGQASKSAASTPASPLKTFALTDAKVAYKPDGTSRRFGFVGFKTEKEAEEAKQWFDKSFIDSMRINVEVVDVSSLRSYTAYPCLVSFVHKLIVVRELGIKKSDQRNAESSKPVPRRRTSPISPPPSAKKETDRT